MPPQARARQQQRAKSPAAASVGPKTIPQNQSRQSSPSKTKPMSVAAATRSERSPASSAVPANRKDQSRVKDDLTAGKESPAPRSPPVSASSKAAPIKSLASSRIKTLSEHESKIPQIAARRNTPSNSRQTHSAKKTNTVEIRPGVLNKVSPFLFDPLDAKREVKFWASS